MVMAWMALRLHMGVHDGDRNLGTGAQGGGGLNPPPGTWKDMDLEGVGKMKG